MIDPERRLRWERGSALAMLGTWVALFSGSALWGGSLWFFHDLKHHHYPWRAWAFSTWAKGELPLWAPVAHGFPLLGDGQSGVLYPVNAMLYGIFSAPTAFDLSIVLHHLAAVFGGFYLARLMGRSVAAATLAGAAYGFSGFLVSHLVYLGLFQITALLPWVVGLCLLTVRRKGPWFLAAGLALGTVWLVGHPQLALYTCYGAGFLAVWEGVERRKELGWTWVARLAAAVGVALVVALPQLMASYELASLGERAGGVDASFAAMGSLPPEELLNGLFPSVFGAESLAEVGTSYHHRGGAYVGRGVSFVETCFYLGVATVMLALLALRRREGLRWWVLGALALGVMLGSISPLWHLYSWLPGVEYLRFPVRASVLLVLAAGQLAALGLDHVERLLRERPDWVRAWSVRWAAVVAVSVLGVAAVQNVGGLVREPLETQVALSLERPAVPGVADSVRGPDEARARAVRVLDELGLRAGVPGGRVLWPAGLAWTLLWLASRVSRGRMLPAMAMRWAVGVLAMDLFVFGIDLNPRVDVEEATQRPPLARELFGEEGVFRTAVLDRRGDSRLDGPLLSSNLGMLWGLEDVIMPTPLRTLRNEAWLAQVGLDLGLRTGAEQVQAFVARRHLADLSGVRFVFTTHELVLPGLVERATQELTLDGQEVVARLYENRAAMNRAFVVGCTQVAGADPLADVVQLGDRARAVAVVEGQGLSGCGANPVGSVEVEREGQGGLVVRTALDGPGWLVLTERPYPGQVITLDGEPVATTPTDYLFQGLELPAGEHEVRFAYLPNSLYLAIAASSVVMAFLPLVFLVWRRRQEEGEVAPEQGAS